MSITKSFRPSSLDGIKKLAKAIGRELDLPHHQALDAAARRAGYAEYAHAQHQLHDGLGQPREQLVYLSAHWRADDRTSGRETLQVRLPKKLAEIVSPHELNGVRQLRGFRVEFEDHLERKLDVRGQGRAQELLHAAARALQFMVRTGLRPATTQRQCAPMLKLNDLPGRDHESTWIHPATGQWVYLDEPYNHQDPEPLVLERQRWLLDRNLNYHVLAPEWSGLYAPGLSLAFLLTPDLEVLTQLRDRLTGDPEVDPPAWVGESDLKAAPFVSPARLRAKKARRSRPIPPVAGRVYRGMLPYGTPFGGEVYWRPAQRMSLRAHEIVGTQLQGLAAGDLPLRLCRHIDAIRCDLDDWVQKEYSRRELSDELFGRLYYGGQSEPIHSSPARAAAVRRVRAVLQKHYAPVRPVRDLLRRLDKLEQAFSK